MKHVRDQERFPEDLIAVMDAADIFYPIKAASFSSPESRYKDGGNEISSLTEHYKNIRTNCYVNRMEGV